MPPPSESLAVRLTLGPALRAQPDRRLVALVRDGYEAAFEEIVRRYGVALRRYAAGIVGGRAEDVTQDAFSKALLAMRRDGAEIELRPWLFRIVRNTALNDLRDSPRSPEELAESLTPGGTDPAEELERREELAELIRRLEALPEQQRAAIVMRELEGLSHEEIATALGLSGGAARQAIYRARQALREGFGMLLPLPLLKAMLDWAGSAPFKAAAAGAGGAGVALKAATATVLIAGAVGAGVPSTEATAPRHMSLPPAWATISPRAHLAVGRRRRHPAWQATTPQIDPVGTAAERVARGKATGGRVGAKEATDPRGVASPTTIAVMGRPPAARMDPAARRRGTAAAPAPRGPGAAGNPTAAPAQAAEPPRRKEISPRRRARVTAPARTAARARALKAPARPRKPTISSDLGGASGFSMQATQPQGGPMKLSRSTLLCAAIGALALALPGTAGAKARDRNHDRIPDRWEKRHHLSTRLNQARRDQDRDHLRNRAEFLVGANPHDSDTDDDGIPDGDENAGKIASFDPETGTLTIDLFGGGTAAGLVTTETEIKCEEEDSPSATTSHSGADDDNSGPGSTNSGPGNDDGDEGNCGPEALVPGAVVEEAELELSNGSAVFEEVELAD